MSKTVEGIYFKRDFRDSVGREKNVVHDSIDNDFLDEVDDPPLRPHHHQLPNCWGSRVDDKEQAGSRSRREKSFISSAFRAREEMRDFAVKRD